VLCLDMSERCKVMTKETLSRKVALVTGAGRGLGRGFALALAAEGMHVGISARTESELNQTADLIVASGGSCHAVVADMSEPDSIRAMVSKVATTLGPIHTLVNNAGEPGHGRRIWEIDPEAWWHTQTVNVRGPFICSQEVLPAMIDEGSGRIINISSNSAFNPWPYFSAYGTSKAALSMMSRTMAAELTDSGVTVFAYSPGPTHTPMWDDVVISPNTDPIVQASFREILEAGTLNTIEDTVANFIRLARGDADELTGCHIHGNDDIGELVERSDEIKSKGLYVIRRQP
jgi:NAD(P)-dependent dehydrogenase (short-subunit alcohol dehydrogenase family)